MTVTQLDLKDVNDPEARPTAVITKDDRDVGNRPSSDDGNSEFSPTHARRGGANSLPQQAPTFGQEKKINLTETEEEPPRKKKKSNKTVRWAAQEQLEEVKYFKMNDEPNKAGLSMAEVQEI